MKTITAKELIEEDNEIMKNCTDFLYWYIKNGCISIYAGYKRLTSNQIYEKYQKEKFKEAIFK